MANEARAPRRAPPASRVRQRGSVIVMFALLATLVLGFMGLALDLGQIYNRQAELQNTADAAALGAARELNGTALGIDNAVAKAGAAAAKIRLRYGQTVAWPEADVKDAISFSNSAGVDAVWVSSDSARMAPDGILFAKFDTSLVHPSPGLLQTFIMHAITGRAAAATTAGLAVAGHSTIKLTPLAVCAMSAVPAASRSNAGAPPIVELVEYGFRRGVGYNLLNLNPNGTAPQHFVVNPIAPLNSTGTAAQVAPTAVAPFICTGTMPLARVSGTGATIAVAAPFPAASLFSQFNSRFDTYGVGVSACNANSAPPDSNVRSYNGGAPNWWMNALGGNQVALAQVAGARLGTVADPLPAPAVPAASYGPLWSYARAVAWTEYVAGQAEPAAGYTTLTKAAWAKLYPGTPSPPAANIQYATIPSTWTPYVLGDKVAPPLHPPGEARRRVLHIPLLNCPSEVAAGSTVLASVLAIGKFFMTAPATSTAISGEFAGVVPEQSLRGPVELYR